MSGNGLKSFLPSASFGRPILSRSYSFRYVYRDSSSKTATPSLMAVNKTIIIVSCMSSGKFASHLMIELIFCTDKGVELSINGFEEPVDNCRFYIII